MKTFIFSILGCLLLVSGGCANDIPYEDIAISEIEYRLPIEGVSESNVSCLSAEQCELLANLEAINDSIRMLDANTRGNITQKLQSMEIIAADAKGFLDGLRYGWSHGKGFFGKMANAALFGTLFSAAYSFVAFLDMTLRGLVNPIAALDNPYNLNQLKFAGARCWHTDKYLTDLMAFRAANSSLLLGDSVAMDQAMLHNQVMEIIDKNDYPESILYNFYTEGDLIFLAATPTNIYYNDIPKIYKYPVKYPIKNYLDEPMVQNASHQYTISILEKYVDGISKITSPLCENGVDRIKALAYSYMREIRKQNSVDYSTLREIETGLYLGTMSAEYWKPRVGDLDYTFIQ